MLLKEIDPKTFSLMLHDSIQEIVSLFDLSGDFGQVITSLEKEVLQFQKTITNGQKLLQDIMK